ncbi:glycoside hydrolase family 3 N-terminal domain-containing protein [Chlorogloeopsis fritschii PCC 9212]|uniref:Glycoside hydrolase family 3 n=1 Tax=Chlorogloeopsis fritschii PCC 6912 TaxID=211165 RepID=A0A3S1AD63_CHLFR|nr:glycoside hydrolase family 3 protein [Chlorogloeopsis fritschii]RUR76262.1 glycoside hydrolase family 3 [Chlorogloeopsis fritschii PCC 6912]
MAGAEAIQSFGHHLIVGISGTTLNDDDKRILNELKPVGVVLYAKNFRYGSHYEDWLLIYQNLIDQIRQYAERDSMFITIDHEGGTIHRPYLPITRFPHAFLLGGRSREVATAAALELKSLGINVSWAPVADIFSNPNNPIIGPRAFGTTPETAAIGARDYYLGLHESGIIGCAKHFPGHGDTSTDSHLELPTLNLTIEELRNRELIPFKVLIDEQVPMIMTAHILFPNIDPDVPATLSQPILNGILRKELGFEGVIVSDDLDMKAVSDMYAKSGTVARTFNAGCDLFIVSRNLPSSSLERTFAIAQDFVNSLSNGSLEERIIEAARMRIDSLLAITPQYLVSSLDKDTLVRHAELAIACSFHKPVVTENVVGQSL